MGIFGSWILFTVMGKQQGSLLSPVDRENLKLFFGFHRNYFPAGIRLAENLKSTGLFLMKVLMT